MVQNQLHFIRRLKRLLKKHRAMSLGYTTELANDGLLVFKPKRRWFGTSDITGTVSQSGKERGFFSRRSDTGSAVIKANGRSGSGFSLRSLLIFAMAFVAFKVFLMFQFGPAGVQARLDVMAEGTLIEKMGVWVMQIDPLTQFVFDQVNYFLV